MYIALSPTQIKVCILKSCRLHLVCVGYSRVPIIYKSPSIAFELHTESRLSSVASLKSLIFRSKSLSCHILCMSAIRCCYFDYMHKWIDYVKKLDRFSVSLFLLLKRLWLKLGNFVWSENFVKQNQKKHIIAK